MYPTPTEEPESDIKVVFDYLDITSNIKIPGANKAIIGWEGQGFSHGYIESFFMIANLCVNKMEQSFEDYYVYSIMYNYRQYIEISLEAFFPENIRKSILEFHNLDPKNDRFRFIYQRDG